MEWTNSNQRHQSIESISIEEHSVKLFTPRRPAHLELIFIQVFVYSTAPKLTRFFFFYFF